MLIQEQHTIQFQNIRREKILVSILSVCTIVGVIGVLWYLCVQYVKIVETLDSSVLGLLDTYRMEERMTRKTVFTMEKREVIGCPVYRHYIPASVGTTMRPVEIYIREDVYSTTASTTVLMRRVGQDMPEEIVSLGDMGEIRNTTLSPDKRRVVVNVGNKFLIVDLYAKKFHTLTIAGQQITTMTFSPDGTKIFLVTTDEMGEYFFIHTLDGCVSEKVYTQITSERGEATKHFFSVRWRADDTIVLMNSEGVSFFEYTTRRLTPRVEGIVGIDSGGVYGLVRNLSESGVCDDKPVTVSRTFDIVRIDNGKKITTIGDGKHAVESIAFSPEYREIVYREWQVDTESGVCITDVPPKYVRKDLVSGQVSRLSETDSEQVLFGWNRIYGSTSAPTNTLMVEQYYE